jgi:hypothetical protein
VLDFVDILGLDSNVDNSVGEDGGEGSEMEDNVDFFSSLTDILRSDSTLSLNEIGLISGNLRNPKTFNILGHSSIVFVSILLLIVTIYLEINFS